jgi:hypothetical protein
MDNNIRYNLSLKVQTNQNKHIWLQVQLAKNREGVRGGIPPSPSHVPPAPPKAQAKPFSLEMMSFSKLEKDSFEMVLNSKVKNDAEKVN